MVRLSPLPPGNPNVGYLQPTTRGIEVMHGNCISDKCAAWRWAVPPLLTTKRQLGKRGLESIVGEKAPVIEHASALSVDEDQEYWSATAEFFRKNLEHPGVISWASHEGWDLVEGPFFNEGSLAIEAKYSRSIDEAAQGYCGLAGKPRGVE